MTSLASNLASNLASSLAADPAEHLEDGCHPSTPDGDNLVLDHIRAEADAYAALATAFGGRVLDVDHAGLAVRIADLGVATPFGATACLLAPVPDDRVGDLAAVLHDAFAGTTGGRYLVFAPWPIADLSGHGFARVGHPPLMFRPAGGTVPPVDGLRIERVHDAEGLADFERTLVDAYPVPELAPWSAACFLHPDVLDTAWRFFVAYDGNDEPVATAAAFVTGPTTMIELVSARPEVRGRGVGAAVTAAAALVEPDRPAVLIASDPGRPVYDRLGFLPLSRYTLWLGTR